MTWLTITATIGLPAMALNAALLYREIRSVVLILGIGMSAVTLYAVAVWRAIYTGIDPANVAASWALLWCSVLVFSRLRPHLLIPERVIEDWVSRGELKNTPKVSDRQAAVAELSILFWIVGSILIFIF